jgi:hypothetical protein
VKLNALDWVVIAAVAVVVVCLAARMFGHHGVPPIFDE